MIVHFLIDMGYKNWVAVEREVVKKTTDILQSGFSWVIVVLVE